jgi:exodeoxyribonuclease VII small subunit
VSEQSGPAGGVETTEELADQFGDLGYEEARDRLVEVVRRLEAGGVTLEESLALWERGEALAARCEQWLAGARARVEAATTATAARDQRASGA